MMAEIELENIEDTIKKKELLKINDPACGSGVLILAITNVMSSKKIDYKRKVLFVAQDIDLICVCMTYIQMFFYRIPGIVIQGNSLSDEQVRVFYTPEYIIRKKGKK